MVNWLSGRFRLKAPCLSNVRDRFLHRSSSSKNHVANVRPLVAIKRGGVGSFTPKIGNLQIIDTGKTSLTLTASVNFTNPTEYSATVPFVDIHILTNGTLLGHATAKDIKVVPGVNTNILVTAVWDPQTMGGEEGHHVGVEFLSQYISGA